MKNVLSALGVGVFQLVVLLIKIYGLVDWEWLPILLIVFSPHVFLIILILGLGFLELVEAK